MKLRRQVASAYSTVSICIQKPRLFVDARKKLNVVETGSRLEVWMVYQNYIVTEPQGRQILYNK